MRGDAAEAERIGALPAVPVQNSGPKPSAPPLLLAETWDGVQDCQDWWISEKLDGVRAYWDGTQFLSRLGNRYHAPEWFTAGLPPFPLDGELWLGRKQFQRTVSIVRRQDQTEQWRELHYRIFDAPTVPSGFEGRLEVAAGVVVKHRPRYAIIHRHMRCQGPAQIRSELARI